MVAIIHREISWSPRDCFTVDVVNIQTERNLL